MSNELTLKQEQALRKKLEEAGDDAVVLVEDADSDEPKFVVIERDSHLASRLSHLLAERGHDGGDLIVDRRNPSNDERGAELLKKVVASLPPPVPEKKPRKGKPSRFRFSPYARGKRPNR